jgi:hypothetical protein
VYDIDTGIDVIQANLTSQQASACLPAALWDKVSSEARASWREIPMANRAIILDSVMSSSHNGCTHSGLQQQSGGACKIPSVQTFFYEIVKEDDNPSPSVSSNTHTNSTPDTSYKHYGYHVGQSNQANLVQAPWIRFASIRHLQGSLYIKQRWVIQ